jgi:hypothetical protein
LQNSVGEEQADSLRLLIVVGGHGAFVGAFRNRPEIVLLTSMVNLRSPRRYPNVTLRGDYPIICALAQRPHSLG